MPAQLVPRRFHVIDLDRDVLDPRLGTDSEPPPPGLVVPQLDKLDLGTGFESEVGGLDLDRRKAALGGQLHAEYLLEEAPGSGEVIDDNPDVIDPAPFKKGYKDGEN